MVMGWLLFAQGKSGCDAVLTQRREELGGVNVHGANGRFGMRFAAHVEPAEQLLVCGETVQFVHGVCASERAGAPNDTPAGLVKEKTQGVGDTRCCGILFPLSDLEALSVHGNNGNEQGCAQRLRRLGFGRSARSHHAR
jgi:hypothetical protein